MRREQFALPLIRLLVNRPRLGDAVFRFDRWGNIFGPERFVDPYPIYERMRESGPVSFSPLYQQWAICGYEEAREILSSDAFGVEAQLEIFLATRPYSKLSAPTRALLHGVLLFADPPRHTRLRSLVNRAFTPRQMTRLEPRIDALARRLIADMADDPCPDVVAGLTSPLPVDIISELLGVPEERWAWAAGMSAFIRDLLDPLATLDPGVVDATFEEITAYYSELADTRRREPRDDLITGLVQAEDGGDRLSRVELISFITLLMFAGHETTTGAMGNAIVALAANPDQRSLIRTHPELWPNAVEELLRFDTALHTDPRTALRDVVVGGETIKQGQNLTIMVGAVNRDPRRYDAPNELRLDRNDPAPLSFGRGIHHCIGASLARMEMRVTLRAFIDAFGDYRIDPDQIEWKRSIALRGPSRLPVIRPAG